jgi:hypothetical protein
MPATPSTAWRSPPPTSAGAGVSARHSWRHRSEGGFDARRYDVAALPEADAKAFVAAIHYSGTHPAVGLSTGPGWPVWLLGDGGAGRRAWLGQLQRPGAAAPCRDQASDATYLGRTLPRRVLLPDGRVLSERAQSKLRNDERGHGYAERELVRFGAPPQPPGEAGDAWLRGARRAAHGRQVLHGGNHRYAFRLSARRRLVAIGLSAAAYPRRWLRGRPLSWLPWRPALAVRLRLLRMNGGHPAAPAGA